jgi:hypothetical protein
MARAIAFSAELLGRVLYWQAKRDWGWIVGGAGAGLLLVLGVLLLPFDLRAQRDWVFRSAQYITAFNFGWAVLYACMRWLAPVAASQPWQEELALPLSRLQRYLHRLAAAAAVPVVVALANLTWFSVVLAYTGVPYNAGYSYTQTLAVATLWWLRMVGVAANMVAAALLAVLLALALELLAGNRTWRVILALGVPTGAVLLARATFFDYFMLCYWQTRGHAPYVYAVLPAAMVVLPGVLAWFGRRWRRGVLAVLAVLLLALALLPFLQYQLPGEFTTATLRELLGDWRFGLAYFLGHLNLWQNIELLDGFFMANVLLDDHTAGNLIPQHLPLWWGAVLYPLALPLGGLAALGLGETLRPPRRD